MGNVSLCSSIVRSGDDFINYVRTSATLARCREIHPPKKMPSEELGIAVLEVRPLTVLLFQKFAHHSFLLLLDSFVF